MARDAFSSGLRGSEKPKAKAKPKRSVSRITIEPASNGGHIVTAEHHQKKPSAGSSKNQPTVGYTEPEKHAHATTPEAHAHVGQLMNQMSTPQEYDGGDGD